MTAAGETRWNLARVVIAECHLLTLVRVALASETLYLHLRSLLGGHAWDRRVFEDASVQELHDVEIAAYNTLILTKSVRFWHGDIGFLQGMNDPVLAVNLVRCLRRVSVLSEYINLDIYL